MPKLTKFKVIFDLFTVCVYFIQQQNCKLYYIYLMIISEIQSEIGHCSCDSAKFKAPADFSHHAILCMTLSLMGMKVGGGRGGACFSLLTPSVCALNEVPRFVLICIWRKRMSTHCA